MYTSKTFYFIEKRKDVLYSDLIELKSFQRGLGLVLLNGVYKDYKCVYRNYILNCNELQWRLREKEESMRFNLAPVVYTLLKSYGTYFYDAQYFNFFIK